uniref:DUF4246 domain-containing protein n=1 Tax=Grammatophora oceanica TaxID=210454 RepID=A0A7S1YNR5_9STRA|mmetsp:Transcript_9777/g.14395  ORF Transcript_9777/g.14395 Transcript_9777/m.14395 type:complete len:389 (+) Transcript_9777:82-1248(+)|eukprot:CAMPEP_0194062502 /NCGR_PEP_ID=MMETSP0009_2-20130614/77750_1 /TAXON_ID=210454 /ORGANISM="Grammatophora oceanica, Strain CCMP 410" /LENGTH=388 /DNA_ID=CAMNT_0038714267 /DNA_START=28 /DNA_END=1194 /DNA_ORIENTATION=-
MDPPTPEKPRQHQTEEDVMIRKLHPDREERWGDGAEATFSYPVYIADSLHSVSEHSRQSFAKMVRAMAADRQDVQPNGIVYDIIDPSLNARLLDATEIEAILRGKRKDDVEDGFRVAEEEEEEYEQTEDYRKEMSDKNYVAKLKNHEETLRLRGSFQWVPTVVKCRLHNGVRSAALQGDISGLPERCFSSISGPSYEAIESIFSSMLPLFAKLDIENRQESERRSSTCKKESTALDVALQDVSLQVVFKVQEYQIPPHSSYTGRWHTEGFSENVLAAGVYYVDVSEDTNGGDLSFRPSGTPDKPYYHGPEGDDSEEDRGPAFWSSFIKDVSVQTGTAVVFNNSIPHRFRTIRNDTDQVQCRLFMNFFVVDPSKELPATTSSLAGPSLL